MDKDESTKLAVAMEYAMDKREESFDYKGAYRALLADKEGTSLDVMDPRDFYTLTVAESCGLAATKFKLDEWSEKILYTLIFHHPSLCEGYVAHKLHSDGE